MQEQLQAIINKLLDERAALIAESNFAALHDYASVKHGVMQIELANEIKALRHMLSHPETFAEQFRQRCMWREKGNEQTIPFAAMPESLTNELYWEIAILVFQPKNLHDMLQIVLPGLKTQLKVSVPDTLPEGLKPEEIMEHVKQLKPIFEKTKNLDQLVESATIKALTHYVLSGDIIFDVNEIKELPLYTHANLQRILHENYPRLSESLYSHNETLQSLAADIQLYSNQGITPKAAIQQLIEGLILGGSRMTGSNDAGKPSDEALKRFFNYFNALIADTQKHLRQLKGGENSLGLIIDKYIELGKCVEKTADYLKDILEVNKNDSILKSPSAITPQALKKLEEKYQIELSDTKKNGDITLKLPAQLATEIIKQIAPKMPEELIVILLNFPPAYYDKLFEHITLNNPEVHFYGLDEAIKNGFFNLEQRQALVKAIARYYQRFNLIEPILFWAIRTNSTAFIEEILGSYPENQRLHACECG